MQQVLALNSSALAKHHYIITTLQHYITILEEHGYEVSRNSRMHRQFSNEDLLILRAFLTLNKERGLKLKDAAQTVTAPSFEPEIVLEQDQ